MQGRGSRGRGIPPPNFLSEGAGYAYIPPKSWLSVGIIAAYQHVCPPPPLRKVTLLPQA